MTYFFHFELGSFLQTLFSKCRTAGAVTSEEATWAQISRYISLQVFETT